MPTVPAISTTVNLADGVGASVSAGFGLQLRHGGNLLTVLDLADAIRMAKMVLGYAEHYGLDAEGGDGDPDGEDRDLGLAIDMAEYMYEDHFALVDGAMEHAIGAW